MSTTFTASQTVEEDTASFVNHKEQTPDTGVSIASMPYVMILAVAMMGAAMMIIRRRKEEM